MSKNHDLREPKKGHPPTQGRSLSQRTLISVLCLCVVLSVGIFSPSESSGAGKGSFISILGEKLKNALRGRKGNAGDASKKKNGKKQKKKNKTWDEEEDPKRSDPKPDGEKLDADGLKVGVKGADGDSMTSRQMFNSFTRNMDENAKKGEYDFLDCDSTVTLDIFNNLMGKNEKVQLLLGEGGSGKTTAMECLARAVYAAKQLLKNGVESISQQKKIYDFKQKYEKAVRDHVRGELAHSQNVVQEAVSKVELDRIVDQKIQSWVNGEDIEEAINLATPEGTRMYFVDITKLTSDTKYSGQFQKRMATLKSEALEIEKETREKVILVFDEAHLLTFSTSESGPSAFDALKTDITTNQLRALFITTRHEFDANFVRGADSASVDRRFFQRIFETPSFDTALSILNNVSLKFEVKYGIRFSQKTLKFILHRSRSVSKYDWPSSAVDLLKTVSKNKGLVGTNIPDEVGLLNKEFARLKREIERLEDLRAKSHGQLSATEAEHLNNYHRQRSELVPKKDKIMTRFRTQQGVAQSLQRDKNMLEELGSQIDELNLQKSSDEWQYLTEIEKKKIKKNLKKAKAETKNALQRIENAKEEQILVWKDTGETLDVTELDVSKALGKEFGYKDASILAKSAEDISDEFLSRSAAMFSENEMGPIRQISAGLEDFLSPDNPAFRPYKIITAGDSDAVADLVNNIMKSRMGNELEPIVLDFSKTEYKDPAKVFGVFDTYMGRANLGPIGTELRDHPHQVFLIKNPEMMSPDMAGMMDTLTNEGVVMLADGHNFKPVKAADSIFVWETKLPNMLNDAPDSKNLLEELNEIPSSQERLQLLHGMIKEGDTSTLSNGDEWVIDQILGMDHFIYFSTGNIVPRVAKQVKKALRNLIDSYVSGDLRLNIEIPDEIQETLSNKLVEGAAYIKRANETVSDEQVVAQVRQRVTEFISKNRSALKEAAENGVGSNARLNIVNGEIVVEGL